MTQSEMDFEKVTFSDGASVYVSASYPELKGRKLKVYLTLKYFLETNLNNGWVKNWILLDVEIGAVSGLRSLRKLGNFGVEYDLEREKNQAGMVTDTWVYKLKPGPIFASFKESEVNEYNNQLPYIIHRINNKTGRIG